MGAIGVIGESAKDLKRILNKIVADPQDINYLINRMINVCIRTTYYLFCKRNSKWERPELLSW